MNALVVDSSGWISYFAGSGHPGDIESALEEGRVRVPPIVVAELASAPLGRRRRRALESFLDDLPLCSCDLAHWLRVGQLRSRLRGRGVTVSTPDAHVAQCAIDLGAELLTEDAIFGLVARHAALRLLR
ncbi:MAG: PIN domain-containing protein [Deltaproteobacteria bacterium]|nr:PIN domain-containing protein [Deltaproteobacteria bacterium]